jgi:hypothetical protein
MYSLPKPRYSHLRGSKRSHNTNLSSESYGHKEHHEKHHPENQMHSPKTHNPDYKLRFRDNGHDDVVTPGFHEDLRFCDAAERIEK